MHEALDPLPLIAILRGLEPANAFSVGAALYESGFRIIEVPLNSPEPFESIRTLVEGFGRTCWIGAGTVLKPEDVTRVKEAGGTLVVMPHSDPVVIEAAKREGLLALPGAATPSEAFRALGAGADAIKMFPAEALPPEVVKAWRAVLPPEVPLLPVGGITPDKIEPYLRAGAGGFGLGSALFRPGIDNGTLAARARAFERAVEAARGG
ncbi:MAG: 2-dehydro-3-deoxy-6-phosphogalactonate aldolase [Geminicoccaceae bacterium]|nr:2-dehydro-3-deoxy-6-phosphogalactonate aldolase [Geminicoccaceae bacterium]